jgi:hypothetical protein
MQLFTKGQWWSNPSTQWLQSLQVVATGDKRGRSVGRSVRQSVSQIRSDQRDRRSRPSQLAEDEPSAAYRQWCAYGGRQILQSGHHVNG